ncbi:Nudix family hydrolase [Lysobacter solisilvae]|uniref:8-oxo-dGTP diphosphatase n=1 Tax=Agrilutibacter solisilvae TaxID=2763317 RepID=A0A975AU69_9GAMM|nr:Nudix family hydrolase [Lysobacter solisilvae]
MGGGQREPARGPTRDPARPPGHDPEPPTGPPSPGPDPAAGAPVEVVAGVIRDARGRILLARRTQGRDLAGLWEFPGGKHEPEETPAAALRRELREELGIEAEVGDALIRVPQAYPHKRLRLDVYAIRAWKGPLRGLEGQALAWVPVHKLADYPMPPADIPVVAALTQPAYYLVTPSPGDDDTAWLSAFERALDGGIRRVQLRAPDCAPDRWRRLASQAAALADRAGAQVLVNADPELARQLGVGVHLRAAQLSQLRTRPLAADLPVAASCHDADDLAAAQALGCDFAVLGTVAPTPSHPQGPVLGWSGFESLREQVSLPLYAIGGLGPDDFATARHHGGQGIAAIRAFWPAD